MKKKVLTLSLLVAGLTAGSVQAYGYNKTNKQAQVAAKAVKVKAVKMRKVKFENDWDDNNAKAVVNGLEYHLVADEKSVKDNDEVYVEINPNEAGSIHFYVEKDGAFTHMHTVNYKAGAKFKRIDFSKKGLKIRGSKKNLEIINK